MSAATELDALLGDPSAASNPVGHAAVLDADERLEMLAEGERLLDGFGLNAEFVPTAYGGRFGRADHLAQVLRTLWRRDPCLGLGYGFSSFIASVNVWSAGTEEQKGQAAALLLANQRIAAAFHELAHGNDAARADLSARPVGHRWQLSGRKEVVANIRRAPAMVVFARTSQAAGSRSHSQFLVVRDERTKDSVRDLPRFHSSGLRGLDLGGVEFGDCPVPAQALVGKVGQGLEITLRAHQVTRAILPSVGVGSLDSALRTVIQFAVSRRLYGGSVADIPYVRAVLARVCAGLLAADAVSGVGIRALHLTPDAAGVYSPAIKYLVSGMLTDAFDELRSVLGAAGYMREGPYAVFQKLARDITPATFAHMSRSACLTSILPQLPRLARRSWLVDSAAPGPLFELDGELPALRLDRLSVGMPRTDGVVAVIAELADSGPDDSVKRLAKRFRDELQSLQAECATLTPSEITIDAPSESFALAARYTLVLAAAALLAVRHHDGDRYPQAALFCALDRIAVRLGGEPILDDKEREGVEASLVDIALERFHDSRTFDLSARRIPG